ncbi:P-loop containing nucleoside triphosphate hydrolase protein, partial [Aureobasidium melanogenum]
MEIQSEEDQALHQQQQEFIAQLQVESDRLQVEQESFEDIEWRYLEAKKAIKIVFQDGTVTPEEKKLFQELHDQYAARVSKNGIEQIMAENAPSNRKRRRRSPSRSPSPLFEPQDKPDLDGPVKSRKISASSKKTRCKTRKRSSQRSDLAERDKKVKKILRRLIAEAPPEKKQAAHKDSARVLNAINQIGPDSIEYLGNGEWSVEGMRTAVKTHQLIHAGWMIERETSTEGPEGGILGDKMGLGKTVCALVSMILAKRSLGSEEPKTNLVVVLTGLRDQWMNEAAMHTVESTSDNPTGLGQIHAFNPKTGFDAEMRQFRKADVVFVTYPELCSAFKNVKYPPDLSEEEKDEYFDDHIRPGLPAIFQYKFRAVYLDEGHQIRNSGTGAAMACQKLMSESRWVLTGTPMTNDPTDLYSVFKFIRHPKVFKLTQKEFNVYYRGSGSNRAKSMNDKTGFNFEWVATLVFESTRSWTYQDELFGRLLTNIPDPIFFDLCKDLSAPEKIIYSTVRKRLKKLAVDRSKDPNATKAHKFVDGLLMRLRQMTGHVLLIHPAIFRKLTDEDVDLIERKICEHAQQTLDPRANDYIVAVRELQKGNACVACGLQADDLQWAACNHAYCHDCLGDQEDLFVEQDKTCERCKRPVYPLVDEAEHEKNEKPRWLNKNGKVIPSTKSAEVVDLLRAWRDPVTGDPSAKAVVFTTFKDALKLLADTFKEQKWKFSMLRADMKPHERTESIKKFNEDPETFIMLATNGVGGAGLNLTAAGYLINYDQYFNESTELQAIGRIVHSMLYQIPITSEEYILAHDLSSTYAVSTAQKNSIHSQDELANDLHTQYQILIEGLEAEHKKKETALLDKIQTAETRYQELESKYQKDFHKLKNKSTKHISKPHRVENAIAVPDNNTELATDNTTKTSESPFQSVSSSVVDFDELCSICRSRHLQKVAARSGAFMTFEESCELTFGGFLDWEMP